MIGSGSGSVEACIDTIEASYEFMLAYAAQGRDSEAERGSGPSIRLVLKGLREALQSLPNMLTGELRQGLAKVNDFSDYIALVGEDSRRATAVIGAVLAVPSISSQLVDNLNASVHVRTILTDAFLIDETLKSFRRPQ
jgi:hypothetical protein